MKLQNIWILVLRKLLNLIKYYSTSPYVFHIYIKYLIFYYFSTVLEGQLRSLMDRVDDLNQEAIKFNRYQQAVVRQATDKHRYLQKRVIFCLIYNMLIFIFNILKLKI